MPSDIVLNDGENKDWVTIEGAVLKHTGSDLMVDSAARREHQRGFRRAMVHTGDDGLTINFNNDYPGGVTLNDLRQLSLRPVGVLGRFRLPKSAHVGDIIMVHYMKDVFMPTMVVADTASHDLIGATMGVSDDDSVYTIGEPVELGGQVDVVDASALYPESPVADGSNTLWVCVDEDDEGVALWSQMPLGDPIRGE